MIVNFNDAVDLANAELQNGYKKSVGRLIALVSERLEALPLSEREQAAESFILSLRGGSRPAQLQSGTPGAATPGQEEAGRSFMAAVRNFPPEQGRIVLLMLSTLLARGVVFSGPQGAQYAIPQDIVDARQGVQQATAAKAAAENELARANAALASANTAAAKAENAAKKAIGDLETQDAVLNRLDEIVATAEREGPRQVQVLAAALRRVLPSAQTA
jgi:hypothetical protein